MRVVFEKGKKRENGFAVWLMKKRLSSEGISSIEKFHSFVIQDIRDEQFSLRRMIEERHLSMNRFIRSNAIHPK